MYARNMVLAILLTDKIIVMKCITNYYFVTNVKIEVVSCRTAVKSDAESSRIESLGEFLLTPVCPIEKVTLWADHR